jgi:hypothetical protein
MTNRRFAGAILTLAAAVLCGCSRTPEPGAGAKKPASQFGSLTLSPENGSGREQVFTLKVTRAQGAPQPQLIGLLINAVADGGGACYPLLSIPSTFLLVNDSGHGSTPMANGVAANKQCELLEIKPAHSDSETRFHIRFRPSFKGLKNIYAYLEGPNRNADPLVQVGQFTVE